MVILLELDHRPNTADYPAKFKPKVRELCPWAAHQTCYGSSVGFGMSNGLGFIKFIRQHLNLEPREGIESKFHGIELEAVREGKVLKQNFWICCDLVGLGKLWGINDLSHGCKILQE